MDRLVKEPGYGMERSVTTVSKMCIRDRIIVMCLSGRGDKDVHTVKKYLNGEETNK